MNNPTVKWIKSNIFIVIFSVLIIASLSVLPIIAKSMDEGVQKIISDRNRLGKKLDALYNTDAELQNPGDAGSVSSNATILVNPSAVNELTQYTQYGLEQINKTLELAELHNRKGRTILIRDIFPAPAKGQIQRKAKDFSRALQNAYEELLNQINAGEAPTLEKLKIDLMRGSNQYLSRTSKKTVAELSDEERKELQQQLTARRIGLCEDAAKGMSVYAVLNNIKPPNSSWDYGQGETPSLSTMFYWQRDYWLIEDVLTAIGSCNETNDNVLTSPVKRVKRITITDKPTDSNKSGGGFGGSGGGGGGGGPFLGGGGAGGGGSGPFLGGGGAGGGGDDDDELIIIGGNKGNKGNDGKKDKDKSSAETNTLNPSEELKPDYQYSITGRKTNGLYDVSNVQLQLVVETKRIPEVLNAIGQQNFMTILSMEMQPADPFSDLARGYTYGSGLTSDIFLEIETIWLRSWTTPFMPDELKEALGIPVNTGNDSGA